MHKVRTIKKMSILLACLLPAILIHSCDYSYLDGIEDIQDYTYSPVVAIPLVSSSISIDDIMDVSDISWIELDEDNLITMVYKGQIFSVEAKNVFSIPNQSQNLSISNITPAASGSTTLPAKEYGFLMTFDRNEILTWISFLEGTFNVTATSDMLLQDGYTLDASFRILNSYDNQGAPIGGTVSLNDPAIINLSGGRIELNNEANFFLVEYTLTISGNGTPDNAPYTVDFFQSLTGTQYDLIQGYIDQIDFPVGNTNIPIELFTNDNTGDVEFKAPEVQISIHNAFGVPLDINVVEFYATRQDNSLLNITGPGVENPWKINHPATPQDIADTTLQVINNDNSNLFQIARLSPKEIYLNVRGLTNPDATLETTNWLKHDSNLNIDVEVKLPLYGQINDFNLQDTLKLPSDSIPEEIDWLELKMIISNGFPLDAEIHLLLIDSTGAVLDTLFKDQPNLLQAAAVNPSTGIATSPAITTIIEMIDEKATENLKNASHLIIDANLKSYNSENNVAVKLLDNYRLGIDMGIRAKAKILVEL